MVNEGRRRAIGANVGGGHSGNVSRSRSLRQSVRPSGHRSRDQSLHRSNTGNTFTIGSSSTSGIGGGTSGGINSTLTNGDGVNDTLSTSEKCKEFARSFFAFIFSKVGLIVLVVGYAIGGALLFQAVEGPHEDKEMHFNQVSMIRNVTLDELWQITTQLNIFSHEKWSKEIDNRIKRFQDNLIEQIRDNGYDGSLSPQWTFSGSFLFALTVITTIGYGNIAPRTDEGKITTILYAIFGIPLMLLYLTNIGGILARSFRFVYGRFCICGNRRKVLAASRNRSIRMQRQRSIMTTPSTPARSPSSLSRFKSTFVSKSPPPPPPIAIASVNQTANDTPASPATSTQQLPSEGSSPQTPGPSTVSNTQVPSSTNQQSSKQKSVTIAPQTPSQSIQQSPTSASTSSTSYNRIPQFIPFQSQYHPLYHHQMSMNYCQSTSDQQIFPDSPPPPPLTPGHNFYDSYYPYHNQYLPQYLPGAHGQPPMLIPSSPISPPAPVSTLVAASTLGSTPAMSPTAAKVHVTRAAAITASASHAISAAASSQDKVHVPISLCLMILVAYVSGGGFLFSIWEKDWGYLEGSYFCFISLSTIGFGDLVPGDAVVAGEGGSQERLIICSLYLLTGLALIAMCFNLMQEEVIHKIKRIGQNLGIVKDPEIDQSSDEDDEDEDEENDDDNDINVNQQQEHNIDHVMALCDQNVDQVIQPPISPFARQMYSSSPVNHVNLSPNLIRRDLSPSVNYASDLMNQSLPSPGQFNPQLMTMSPSMMYNQPPPPPPPPPFPPSPSSMQPSFPYNWTSSQS